MSEAPISLLSDELKDTIQDAYRAWLQARDFKPRRGQREMIAHVARALTADSERIAIIEAGTGTGKTAGYCLAAIPTAQALNKTIILSTATIALQEQVTIQDIPDLKDNAGLRFTVSLAKGRGRYVCLKRLDDHLKYQDQKEIPLFEEFDADHTGFFQSLLDAYGRGEWDGELDSWPDEMPDGAWGAVTTDHRGCANNRCSFFKQCPFFKARNDLEGVDVIVANHDLVLADLALGGGAVLPEPEDCIYILDEAHHLADKTQNHFSASARINGTLQWLDHVNAVLGSLTQRFARPDELVALATSVATETGLLRTHWETLGQALDDLVFEVRDETLETCRFSLGEVPEEVATLAGACTPGMERVCHDLDQVHTLLQAAVAGDVAWEKAYEAEDWLVPVGQLESRASAGLKLLNDYANGSPYRHARWVNRRGMDVEMVSAPIEPGYILQDVLWGRAYGVICTSATLSALGRFDRFIERTGLAPGVTQVRIPSPFDFPRIASFTVPEMQSDPRDFDAHSEEVASLLPDLVVQEQSALVLSLYLIISGWRATIPESVYLPPTWGWHDHGNASEEPMIWISSAIEFSANCVAESAKDKIAKSRSRMIFMILLCKALRL